MIRQPWFNIIILISERIVQLGGGLFVSGIIARYLTVDVFSSWQLSLQLLAYAGTLGLVCGAEIILPRLSHGNVAKLLINGFLLRFLFGCIATIVAIATIFIIDTSETTKIFSLVIFLSLLINEPFAIFSCYLQSKTNNLPLSIVRLLSVSLRIGIVVYIIHGKYNFYFLSIAWLVESVVTAIGYFACFLIFKSKNVLLQFSLVSASFMKPLVLNGCIFLVSQFLLMTALKLDRIVVSHYASTFYTGNYLAVSQLFDALMQFSIVINTVFLTSYFYNKDMNYKSDIVNTAKLSVIYIIVSLIGSLIIFKYSNFITDIVFGEKYILSPSILRNVSFVLPLYTLSLLWGAFFFKYSLYFKYLIVNAISAFFVVIFIVGIVYTGKIDKMIFTPYIYAIVTLFTMIYIITSKKNERNER